MISRLSIFLFFFFNDTATTEIYTLSLHDALPISKQPKTRGNALSRRQCRYTEQKDQGFFVQYNRSEEHTSELQSPDHLVCRLLLEKKKNTNQKTTTGEQKGSNIRMTQQIQRHGRA